LYLQNYVPKSKAFDAVHLNKYDWMVTG
jgi:hypothetical protein